MSTNNVSKNSPDAIKANATKGGGKKSGNGGMVLILAMCGLAVVAFVLIFSSGGSKKEKPKEEVKAASVADAAKQKAPRVYDKSSNRKIERSDGNNGIANAGTQEFSESAELVYGIDDTTNLKTVKTPAGYVLVDSPEGRKYIDDFNNLKNIENPQAQPSVAALQIPQEKLDDLRRESNEQVRILDEKINEVSGQIEGLIGVIKKQNETIAKLTTQVKSIQPMVKTPEELAATLFGKNGKKVLKERNNALVADVIIGDKAFITDINGETHVLRVGDIVPGTSSIVSLIDETSKQVILKH